MSTIQPPPSSPLPTSTSGTATTVPVTLSNPTAALIQLTSGTRISAQVQASPQTSQVQIQTQFGKFTLQSPVPLQANQNLVLQIAGKPGNAAAPLLLQLLSIDGRVVTANLSPKISAKPTTIPTPAAAQTNAPTVNLTVGSTLSATLLTVQPQTLGQGQGPQGQTGILGQTQASPTAAPIIQGNVTSQGQAPSTNIQTAGTSVPVTQNTGLQPLQNNTITSPQIGGRFSVSIQAVTPAGITPPTPSAVPNSPANSSIFSGQTLVGTITSATASGNSIIQTLNALISLATSQSLPAGTQVVLKVESEVSPPPQERTIPATMQKEAMLTMRSWPNLDEGLAALREASPALANQITAHVIPKANVQFTASALFFLTALRAGDAKSWLGDQATKLLEKVKPEVMRKLSDDFRILGGRDEEQAGAPRTNDWRGALIPFQNGELVEQIRFYSKPLNQEDDEDGEKKKGTRFLIDVTLTNIGRFQLDGMLETASKKLDMIIRTSNPLPSIVKDDMQKLFVHANDTVGMHGGMSFQATPDAFIEPAEEFKSEPSGLGISV